MEHTIQGLTQFARNLRCYDIASVVIEDPRFPQWSGSSKSSLHHYGDGKLLKHTCEVIELAFDVVQTLGKTVNKKVLFLGCLFHDYGKIWDYQRHPDQPGQWIKTQHKRDIHHISRSAIEWTNAVRQLGEVGYLEIEDQVTHMILSHHGQRDWGSPVAPRTLEAWVLHLCDGLSARCDDWNTSDRY